MNDLFKKIMFLLISTTIIIYFINKSNKFKDFVFTSYIDYQYVNNTCKYLFGNISNKEVIASSNKLNYESIEELNGIYKVNFEYETAINNIKGGVVIFIGKLDNYGKTIKIKSENNLIITYSNLDNISVNLYDYVNQNEIIASSVNNYILLEFRKDNKLFSYEDFI